MFCGVVGWRKSSGRRQAENTTRRLRSFFVCWSHYPSHVAFLIILCCTLRSLFGDVVSSEFSVWKTESYIQFCFCYINTEYVFVIHYKTPCTLNLVNTGCRLRAGPLILFELPQEKVGGTGAGSTARTLSVQGAVRRPVLLLSR